MTRSRSAPRMGGNLRQPEAERSLDNKTRAVSFAAHAALVDLFPARQAIYAQQMADLGYVVDGSDTSTAAMVGAAAAQAVLDYRHHDGANQLGDRNGGAPYSDYTGYQPGQKHLGPDQGPRPLAAPMPPPPPTGRHRVHRQGPDVPDPVLGQGHTVRAHQALPSSALPARIRTWGPTASPAASTWMRSTR